MGTNGCNCVGVVCPCCPPPLNFCVPSSGWQRGRACMPMHGTDVITFCASEMNCTQYNKQPTGGWWRAAWKQREHVQPTEPLGCMCFRDWSRHTLPPLTCQNSWFPSTSTLFFPEMNEENNNGIGSLDVHSDSDVSSLIRSSSVHPPATPCEISLHGCVVMELLKCI